MEQCRACLTDECVGVRAAVAACIAALVRNSVRLRVSFPGLEEGLQAAVLENGALLASIKGGGSSKSLGSRAIFDTLRGEPLPGVPEVEERAEEFRQVKDATGILECAARACGEALETLSRRP